jgi:hypothetical protein
LREVDIHAASMVDLRAARAGHLLWRKPRSAKFANLSIASRTNSIGAFLKAGLFMIELYRAIMEGNRRYPLMRDRSSFRERLRSSAYSIRSVEGIEWLRQHGSDRDQRSGRRDDERYKRRSGESWTTPGVRDLPGAIGLKLQRSPVHFARAFPSGRQAALPIIVHQVWRGGRDEQV